MPNTTNFNWSTPADTDLVKDGASAIRTLGNNIDTSLVDLKGGTTGQVLAKNSNTDLDFVWSSDQVGIPASIVDAKGDIIAATAADTVSRLAVGANDTVLMADSTAATGLKWGTVSAGSNWSLLNAGGTSLSGTTTTVSGISNADKIMVLISGASSSSASSFISVRLNGDTGNNYREIGGEMEIGSSYAASNFNIKNATGSSIDVARMSTTAAHVVSGYVLLSGCNSSGVKVFTSTGAAQPGTGQYWYNLGGYYDSSSVISSVSVVSGSGSFDAGTVFIYTSA
jgi:hypothetical protein